MNEIDQQLAKTIKEQNWEQAKSLLLNGANPNVIVQYNETPLFSASEFGNLEIVSLLLEKGANVHHLNNGKQSPLHSACYGGHLEIVKKLLNAGANPKQLSLRGTSPVAFAFYKLQSNVIGYFMQNGLLQTADLSALDSMETEATLKSMGTAHKEALNRLYDVLFPKNTPINLDFALTLFAYKLPAIKKMSPTLLTRLFPDGSPNIDLANRVFSALFKSSNAPALELLLKKIPSLKDVYLKKENLEGFLDHFEEAETMKKPPGAKIIGKTMKEYIKWFEEWCTTKLKNPLIQFFLKNGLTPDMKNSNGQTLLHLAALRYQDEYEHCCELISLLGMGYPVDVLNSRGQTPLMQALEGDVNDPYDKGGMLYHAIYLIYSGANVKAVDPSGRTVLDYAHAFCAQGLDDTDSENIEFRNDLIQIIHDYSSNSNS